MKILILTTLLIVEIYTIAINEGCVYSGCLKQGVLQEPYNLKNRKSVSTDIDLQQKAITPGVVIFGRVFSNSFLGLNYVQFVSGASANAATQTINVQLAVQGVEYSENIQIDTGKAFSLYIDLECDTQCLLSYRLEQGDTKKSRNYHFVNFMGLSVYDGWYIQPHTKTLLPVTADVVFLSTTQDAMNVLDFDNLETDVEGIMTRYNTVTTAPVSTRFLAADTLPTRTENTQKILVQNINSAQGGVAGLFYGLLTDWDSVQNVNLVEIFLVDMVKIYLYVGGLEDKIVLMLEVAMGFVLVLFVLLSAFLSTKIYHAVKNRQIEKHNMEKYQIP